MRGAGRAFGLVWWLLTLSMIGCSAGSDDTSGTGATGSGNTGSGNGGNGGDGGIIFAGGSGGGSGCTTCSSDLHSVLDCETGQVIRTCPDDQGCGPNGTCVAPCESASANQSSIGCEYFMVTPDGWSTIPDMGLPVMESSDGSCFAAYVNNTWPTPVSVTVEYNGASMDAAPYARIPQGSGSGLTYQPLPNGQIPPDEMAIVFLSHDGLSGMFKTPCPSGITPAYVMDTGQHGTGIGHAVRLATSAPAVVYDIYPYGGAISYITSATLLLPTSAWDTNYVAATTDHVTMMMGNARPSGVTVVAQTDGTEVTLLPTQAIAPRGPVGATPANQPVTYSLNRGELLHLLQIDDLTGTPIQSNHPVAMWGQHYCMNIPTGVNACDPGHQQIPPVRALGTEYVAVRYRNRAGAEESVPWRLVGMVDGTTLSFEPAIPGAPTALNQGQLATFDHTGPFVVRSQDDDHPFYAAAHMTGGEAVGNGNGDPETVTIVPVAQWLDKYIFFADPTYGNSNLVVVRKQGPGGFADVSLDCLGVLSGWQPVGEFEYTRVDLQIDGAPVGVCDNGRHVMESEVPFGITVWGFDQYVSYAYPAGASVKPINTVEVPPVPH